MRRPDRRWPCGVGCRDLRGTYANARWLLGREDSLRPAGAQPHTCSTQLEASPLSQSLSA